MLANHFAVSFSKFTCHKLVTQVGLVASFASLLSLGSALAQSSSEVPAFVKKAGYNEGISCEGGFGFWADFDALKFAVSIPEALSGSDAETGYLFDCMQKGTVFFSQNIGKLTADKVDLVTTVLLRPNGKELDIGDWSEISN
ncbi:hypothetical protein [uncultured Roseobacter sp.]|uniref:hypothetical protein n=1 Tax=uncultured Roseobacter sp. TaxID=114847 RepID=UPI002610ADDC|nr:hypothetical protein [uncultured Roseobacter sp.]